MKKLLCTSLFLMMGMMLTGIIGAAEKQEIEQQIKNQVDEVVAAIDSGKKAEDFKILANKEPYPVFIMEQNGKFLVSSFPEGVKALKPAYDAMLQATVEGLWVEMKGSSGRVRHNYLKKTKDGLIVGSGYFHTGATMTSTMTPYVSPSGRGPMVILLSGASGPEGAYKSYAAEVARLGYYAVLLDGRDFTFIPGMNAEVNLRRTIEQAQRSPNAFPGKVVVIGFSMGGGGALAFAAHMPDLVSAVIAYYPMIREVSDMRSFAARFQVPILVLAGEQDRYLNCCLIEFMRAMEAAAKESGKPFELVVYPKASHAFTWENTPQYRPEASADAWQRTTKMISQYQPLR